MNRTGIVWPWPDLFTVNPFIGCSKVSEGCENCYAEAMAKRLAAMEHERVFGPAQVVDMPYTEVIHDDGWNNRTVFRPETLNAVVKRRKPASIFWCSMSDLFHESNRFKDIYKVFEVIAATPHLTHIILTKRPERMRAFFVWMYEEQNGVPVHIWEENSRLGVTAENQARADERIPILLSIPGNHRTFVSVEPMLGAVDIRTTGAFDGRCEGCYGTKHDCDGYRKNGAIACCPDCNHRRRLDAVICGGESGPNARSMNPEWARALRDQCRAARVPFWMKQMSGREPIPTDLMVKEAPDA